MDQAPLERTQLARIFRPEVSLRAKVCNGLARPVRIKYGLPLLVRFARAIRS